MNKMSYRCDEIQFQSNKMREMLVISVGKGSTISNQQISVLPTEKENKAKDLMSLI